jgi:hypothetical protein
MSISTESGTERSAERVSARRRRPARLRNVVVACTSVGVLLVGALYLVAPTSVAWAISVHVKHDSHHAGHNDQPGTEVVYGKATDSKGNGVSGVQILVLDSQHNSRHPLATIVSGADGTYRQTLSLRNGKYVLAVVSGSGNHHDAHGTTKTVDLKSGNTYQTSVHLKKFGLFFFLPVSSY